MIKIEDVEVMGMRKAIKGMRNAMNSWDKSDSIWCANCPNTVNEGLCINVATGNICNGFIIGKEDMKLAKSLIKSGKSHRKYMRMIHVQADVTGPLYWWKQTDQYRIGVTTNSTSTMHTIHKRDLTIDDFSNEHLIGNDYRDVDNDLCSSPLNTLRGVIFQINSFRKLYLKGFKGVPGDNSHDIEPKDKHMWWQMIQLLPSSFNQMRTIDLSYETLFSMYHERKNHKLNEWVEFCKWIETLPYMKEFLNIK